MKAGTFEAYPPHSADPYRSRTVGSRDMMLQTQAGKYFIPSAGPKSAPSSSVLDRNIVRLLSFLVLQIIESFISRNSGWRMMGLMAVTVTNLLMDGQWKFRLTNYYPALLSY